MLNTLASGTLTADPVRRQGSKSGRDFCTASLRVPTDGGEAILCSLIAFDPDVVDALLAHVKADTLAIAGRAKMNSWTGRDGELQQGLSIVVERVMSAYQVGKQRRAARESEEVPA